MFLSHAWSALKFTTEAKTAKQYCIGLRPYSLHTARTVPGVTVSFSGGQRVALVPSYNEFGYSEYPPIMSSFHTSDLLTSILQSSVSTCIPLQRSVSFTGYNRAPV